MWFPFPAFAAITDAERRLKESRTMPGSTPDTHRTEAGRIPDNLHVAQATPDLTRGVRDGVFFQDDPPFASLLGYI